MAGYYDPNKDYSLAIVNAQKRGATEAEIKQLQQERQNKINAQYGGADPYKGTSNVMGTSGKTTGGTTNYRQEAYDAAAKGDWDRVGTMVNGLMGPNGDMTEANRYMKELQDQFQYNAEDYYRSRYDDTFGQGAWDNKNGGGNQSAKLPSGNNSGNGYDSFQEFLEGMGYNDYTTQTQKYIQAAVANAVKGYENQIDAVNRDTQEMARQAYIANMMGRKNMDQQLAASGLAGGIADSQKIAMQANYENNLNNLELERQETVKELQLAIENAKLTGDMQTAQELSNYLQQMQSRWYDYTQSQMAMENQNYWNNMELEAENKNTARNWALTLIQNGTMPDESTLAAAGMTAADAKSMLNYVRQQNAPKSVEPEPVKYTEAQAGAALLALMAGSDDEKARSIVESYYGMPAETVINAYGEPTTKTPVQEEEPQQTVGNAAGMNASYFNAFASSLAAQLQSGKVDAAQANLESRWGEMSVAQQQSVMNLLAKLGY